MSTWIRTALVIAAAIVAGCATSYHEKGFNLHQNGQYQLAYNEYNAGAQQGDSNAMNNMGLLIEEGKVVIVDGSEPLDAAVSWYNLSARYGNPTAQQNLRRLGQPIPAADLYVQPAPQTDNSAAWGIVALGLLNGAAAYQDGTNQGRADANAIAREDDRVREQQRQDRINTQKITSSIDRLGW
jgi:TPR repeat protein